MSWPKPEIISLNPPDKPRRWFWIALFAAFFIITTLFLIASWGDNDYFSSLSFWLIAIVVPFVFGSVALSIRFYLYGLAQEHFDIWQQEQQQIDGNWQEWAMSSASIIASYWITPNALDETAILCNRVELPMQCDKVLEFDDNKPDHEHYFDELFYRFVEPINKLPDNTPIAITVYSSSQSYTALDNTIEAIYRRHKINKPYSLTHQTSAYAQLEQITDVIDTPQRAVQLIIVNNLQSKGSAFLAALLLADKQFEADADQLLVESNLLRPMVSDNIAAATQQMAEMQPGLAGVAQLWYANVDKAKQIEIAKGLSDHGVSPDGINALDSLAGQQTDLAYWSLLALGNKLVKQSQQDILLVTSSQGQYLFSVLTRAD
ncbi:hypothetical protein RHO12_09965 [Orbus sturtevantii]|uniref:hypothetical protein n=1 Tax=Orbus sturtevantii TaxID=3074109 RepID=UPI00370DC75B